MIDREKVEAIHKQMKEHTVRNKELKQKAEDDRKEEELSYVERIKKEIVDNEQ